MQRLFGGADNRLDSSDRAKVVVLPVPYGKTVTYRRGTEKGPAAILEASDNMELFDEELKEEIFTIGISTLPPLRVNKLVPREMIKVVERRVSNIFRYKKMPVVLGGEHSITIGAVRAARQWYKNLSVLYFDAHYDMKDSYRGTRYSHACAARRLADMTNVVEVGVRSLSKKEYDFVKTGDIRVMTSRDITRDSHWYDTVKKYLTENVYISIDLDVFDPSIMQSVGTPEPGGMLWYEFLDALHHIIKGKKIVAFDVVELSPIKNIIAPDFTAARLIYKILGYIFFK